MSRADAERRLIGQEARLRESERQIQEPAGFLGPSDPSFKGAWFPLRDQDQEGASIESTDIPSFGPLPASSLLGSGLKYAPLF